MKLNKKLTSYGLLLIALVTISCEKDFLQEEPYTSFTPEYFRTQVGLEDAVNAIYAGLRYDFGPNGALAITTVGTDEWTYGDQPATGQDGDVLRLGTYTLDANNGAILTPWNRNYSNINLANAVLEFAPDVNMPEDTRTRIMAEAHFLRAQYYILLVQQFGAVPVNLGAGDLEYNNSPTNEFYRLPMDEVLAKDYEAMINDLIYASENLPDQRPENAFRLSKAAAFLLLSKVYLYRGYSSVSQPGDFENSLAAAEQLVNNSGTYGTGLLQDFGMVHQQGNDYNREILFSVERLPLNNAANEVGNPGSDFSNKVNIANNMFNANYTATIPSTYPNSNLAGEQLIDSRPLQYGRPLRRYAPLPYVYEVAFADKVNDSRYNNSFRTVWYASTVNEQGTDAYNTYVNRIAELGLEIGDTAIYLAPTDAEAERLKPIKNYWVLGPSDYYTNQNPAIQLYPNLKKYDDTQRAAFNDVSGRPFIVSKFSEAYLLAAEAAFQLGQLNKAADYLNVIRERAAYRPELSSEEVEDRRDEMTISASDVTMDFILNERTRELVGESMRWPDLAMRGMLLERVREYNPDAAPNIEPYHRLRPIPQSQLNSISDPNGDEYQNPGY
ncbi:RagB/SusD family nutrient uptake outer membrane protein [Zunongwangia sp. H14]|uniref:RagB/SusD family nutrient uptake outer membrane protein n=1 Tax=Zunongwangia sp. H14 TaxID=3240792 RepID=UPI003568BC3E